MVQGPGLATGGRQLPFAKVAVRQGSVGMRGRGPRLQHYGAAGDVNGHAGMLDEEVLQGVALEAGGPESGPLCSKTGGRGNKPALVHQGGRGRRAACGSRSGPGAGWSRVAVRQINDEPAVHFILLGDEGSGVSGVLGGRGSTEEEAGEALEHGGRVKRSQGGAQRQCRYLSVVRNFDAAILLGSGSPRFRVRVRATKGDQVSRGLLGEGEVRRAGWL